MGTRSKRKRTEDLQEKARILLNQGVDPASVKSLRLRRLMESGPAKKRAEKRFEKEMLKIADSLDKIFEEGKLPIERKHSIIQMTEEELIERGITPDKFILVGNVVTGFKIKPKKSPDRKIGKETMIKSRKGFKIYEDIRVKEKIIH